MPEVPDHLVRELRPHGKKEFRYKWVRPEGARSPSNTHEARRHHYERVHLRALRVIGDKCVHCDYSDERALQIDHIEGGGSEDRRKYKGVSYYYFILNNPDLSKYQILCANCNVIKRCEQEECRKPTSRSR